MVVGGGILSAALPSRLNPLAARCRASEKEAKALAKKHAVFDTWSLISYRNLAGSGGLQA